MDTKFVKNAYFPCEFPDNANDVAAAIAYVLNNARKYGATGKSVSLIGHSAGAHLAALVSTDEKYLKKFGKTLSNINFVAPLDTDAFDLRARGGNPQTIIHAFGRWKSKWDAASPITHANKGRGRPPHLLVYRGDNTRKKNVEAYAKQIQRYGSVKTFYATQYTHKEINTAIGKRRERVVTPQIHAMLNKYNPRRRI